MLAEQVHKGREGRERLIKQEHVSLPKNCVGGRESRMHLLLCKSEREGLGWAELCMIFRSFLFFILCYKAKIFCAFFLCLQRLTLLLALS